MPLSYPPDLRERFLAARAAGLPVAEIEDKSHVSRRTVNRWQQRQVDATLGLAPNALAGAAAQAGPGR